MNSATNVQKLGRFTVSIDNSNLPHQQTTKTENTTNYEPLEQLYEFLDSLVMALSNSEFALIHTITENPSLFTQLKIRDLDLITFNSSVQRYLTLFDDLKQLKHNIIVSTITSCKNDITRSTYFSELPLCVQYAYVKYSNSLLVSQPSLSCCISLEELKQFVNNKCVNN